MDFSVIEDEIDTLATDKLQNSEYIYITYPTRPQTSNILTTIQHGYQKIYISFIISCRLGARMLIYIEIISEEVVGGEYFSKCYYIERGEW